MGVTGPGTDKGIDKEIDEGARDRLRDFLADAAESEVEIAEFRPLPGGAIQENWLLDITVSDGDWAGEHELVLRRDAPSAVAASHGRAEEFAILKAAHEAGVTVPAPCLLGADPDILGGPFFIMHRVGGEAAGHKLVRRPPNDGLAAALGTELARIHSITPGEVSGEDTLSFLDPVRVSPALDAVGRYRHDLDGLGTPRPGLEWGLRWLERNAPERNGVVLCHRDYRTGNYMVSDDGELTGILDWEFAGWGEPEEDLGWFTARCWRFGAYEREGGGIAGAGPFFDAYERASGRSIDPGRVAYWQAMAHVRWAVIACQQAHRHVSGKEPSLELALTQHVVPELELEVLRLTDGAA
jgi:aminoglycoside phosphotransferase (APT) family kinase protein